MKNVKEFIKSLDIYRLEMYELVKVKDLTDPCVIKISQQLDRVIIKLQRREANNKQNIIGINDIHG